MSVVVVTSAAGIGGIGVAGRAKNRAKSTRRRMPPVSYSMLTILIIPIDIIGQYLFVSFTLANETDKAITEMMQYY